MKKSATFLSDYRKIFSFLMVFFLASFQANSTNPVISNYLTNLSAMVNQEAIYDIKPEMIIEGNTIHVVWIEQMSVTNNKLYYCRSIDLGKTWQTPILIADQTYIDGNSNRKLAVDGNNVHIAIGMGSVVYYARSTNGGSSFEPGRELVSKPGDGNLRNFQIRAANGKVAIAYQGTPSAKNGLFMLSSIDGGLTFTDKLITSQSTRLSDFWYDGAQMVVVSEYTFSIGGWNKDCRVFVSVSNDNGSSFTTQKIIYTNEAGDEKTALCQHDIHYVPKIAKSGNNIHIIFRGGINDDWGGVWKTLYARSTDNGQTFEKAKDINNGIMADASLALGQETVVAKNGHVYMTYLSKAAKVYLVQSADNGNTLATAKSILPEGYSYVGGTGFPGLVIDPTDASGSTVYIYGNAMFSTKSTDGGNTFSECMVVVPIHESIRSIQSDLVIDSNGNKHWISEAKWWEGTDTDIFYKFVGPEPEPGTKNKSLFFETVYNSKVDVAIVPSSPSLDFDSALTAEAWVKFDLASIAENSVDISFFAKVNGVDKTDWTVPGGFMMGSRKRWGQMIIYSALGTDKGNFSNVELWEPGIGDTLWHHVAFTYDANGGLNNFKTYVDGLLTIQQTVTGEINQGNGLFMIGAKEGSFRNSKYQIDNIRLWNRALSQDELLQNQLKTFTGKEDSLKLFLNFDDTFKDISGNGNDAIPLHWGVLKESDFNPPIPEFDLYQNMNQVSLTNKTQNGKTYKWSLGDGTTSDQGNPVYTYPTAGEYIISLEASNANSKTAIIKKATIVGLDRIEPIQAGNGGYSSISVFGGGLIAEGTSVSLRKTGSSDIVGENLFSPGLGLLSAQFYLENASLGKWDVMVKKGTSEQILKEAFQVVLAEKPDPWAYISGRGAVLINMWQTYTITYGNNGNVDAYGVPVWFAITDDKDIEIEFIDFEMKVSDYAIEKGIAKEITDMGEYFSTDMIQGESFKAKVYPFMVPVIQAKSTSSIHIRIKSPKRYQMKLWTNLPWYDLTSNSSSKSTKNALIQQSGYNWTTGECIIGAIAQELIDVSIATLGDIPGCIWNFGYFVYDTGQQIRNKKATLGNIMWNAAVMGTNCGIALAPWLIATKFILSTLVNGVKNVMAIKDCMDSGKLNTSFGMFVDAFSSFDPNEMIGPAGFGDKHWIQKNNSIPYTILFENKSTATAPAHQVFVTDTLDLEKFDLKEFGFGSFGFGDTTLTPNGKKLKQFSMDVNLNPKMNLIARISGKLDTISGVVRWEFLSLNPTNMELEEDPFIGFLPPNNTERAGEGYVSFSVGLKKELGTNAALKNKASIVFDANTPILTNEFTNTLDLDKPQSQVYPLDATIDSRFPLAWTGSDNGSGIASYSVYVLENDTALSAWKLNTSLMTAEFIGNVGSKYKFYSVATDNVSLVEGAPANYDASTQITVHVEEFEMKKDELQVFPNPVTDKLTISLANAPCGMYVVELVGINGQVCYSELHDDFSIAKGIQIGVEGYRSGPYLVRMVYGNKSVTRKVMIR